LPASRSKRKAIWWGAGCLQREDERVGVHGVQDRGTFFTKGFERISGREPLSMTVLTNFPKKGWAVISTRASILYSDWTCLRSEKCRVANGVFETAQRYLFVRRRAGRLSRPAKSMTFKRISGGMLGSERPRPPSGGPYRLCQCVFNRGDSTSTHHGDDERVLRALAIGDGMC
jgi:hypothetical protein